MGLKKIFLLTITICVSAIIAISQSYNVYRYSDTLKDHSINRLNLNTLPSKKNGPVVSFNPGFVKTGDTILYQISMNYQNSELLFIDKGYSLVIIADSTDISLQLDPSSKTSKRKTNEIGQVFYEVYATYPITLWQLLQMRESNFLTIEIRGLKRIMRAEFSSGNMKIFRKYFREEIIPAVESIL